MESESVEIFVISEQPIPAGQDQPQDTDGVEATTFEVHLVDEPPELGGTVWEIDGSNGDGQMELHDALLSGLITEVPREILEDASVVDAAELTGDQ